MKEGFKIILCGVEMEFRYYSGRNSVFAWYDKGKEYLYMKLTAEVERELEKNVPRELKKEI